MTDNVYDKAREVIKERGRHQGDLVDTVTGKVCLIGALYVAETGEVNNQLGYMIPANGPLALTIREQFPDRVRPVLLSERVAQNPENRDSLIVYEFNDGLRTTDADVDMVLDKAARAADETDGAS